MAAHPSRHRAALLMAWTKWIIDNKKYDEDFCTNWTNMPTREPGDAPDPQAHRVRPRGTDRTTSSGIRRRASPSCWSTP
ncbi:MAG: hypothetical protein ACLSVD_03710 [Eggerthellaceae bacterium]